MVRGDRDEDQEREAASPWTVPAIGAAPEETSSGDKIEPDALAHVFAVHAPRRPLALAAAEAGGQVVDPGGIDRVAQAPDDRSAPFVWLSAHGGAGATSLARSSGVGLELTRQWPAPELGWPGCVAVVCRSNAAGLDAAAGVLAAAAADEAGPGVWVGALVVVDDAPTRVSRAIRARIYELAGTVPRLVRVPWISSWRDSPYTAAPAAVRAAAAVRPAIGALGARRSTDFNL